MGRRVLVPLTLLGEITVSLSSDTLERVGSRKEYKHGREEEKFPDRKTEVYMSYR